MKIPCAHCGELHDIANLEPSFARPDAFLAVPVEERPARTRANENFCEVRDSAEGRQRWFVRVLVPVPVRGVEKPCCWGIWSEVSAADFARISLLWDDPDQCRHPPFAAVLANDLDGYPPTGGLRGTISFRDVKSIPFFEFDPEVRHPFAEETREGVTQDRVLEWLAPVLHQAEIHDPRDDPWPFDQAPDVAAITTRFVLDEGLPILLVTHYSDDHSWAFVCGTTNETDDGRVISMRQVLRLDATLRDVADLPPGWSASRARVGGDWHRTRDSET
jgi:hypothetical protein